MSIVSEFYPNIIGGLGTYANGIYHQMVMAGHKVNVITFNDQNGSLPHEQIVNCVNVYRNPVARMPGIFSLLLSKEWQSWIGGPEFIGKVALDNFFGAAQLISRNKAGQKFDIVAANDWLAALAGMVIKENSDLPIVFHMHSDEHGRSGGNPFLPIATIEKEFSKAADLIVTVSYPMAEHLINLGFEASKIRVCWNGIDPMKYDPARITAAMRQKIRRAYGIASEEKMLLFIGRLTDAKGILELIHAMSLIDDKTVKLVVLGEGPLKEQVSGLIADLGLKNRVMANLSFLGEEKKIAHISACDLAVFPSKYEPFGIVSLEAMAMEKPLIVGTSGINGFKDQVISSGEHQTGFHVNGQNPADIADWGIKPWLALSNKERLRLGQNGRQRVMKHFTWEQIAQRTINIYQEAISMA